MSFGNYYVGSQSRLRVTFTDAETGAAADPTTITIIVREPNGTETEHVYGIDGNVIKQETGIYYYKQIFNAAGRWAYRGKGVGVVVAAAEKVLQISMSGFQNP